MIPQFTFAPSSAITGAGSRRFVGRIQYTNVQRGFGFILCKEASEHFGKDVFLHTAQQGPFQANEEVDFAVLLNKDGMPQAFDLTWPQPGGPGGAPPKGVGKGGKGDGAWTAGAGKGGKGDGSWKGDGAWDGAGKGGKGDAWMMPAAPAAGKGGESRHAGTIIAFTPGTYGFIRCEELYAIDGKDIWLHHKQVANFNVGDSVNFTLITNARGQAQAVDLQAAWSSSKRPRQESWVPEPTGDERYVGKIITYRPGAMFGFIQCDDTYTMYGKDVWTHQAQLGNFSEGDEVSFSLVLNKDGHPQAVNLVPAGGGKGKRAKW